jgi:hypothetical protein
MASLPENEKMKKRGFRELRKEAELEASGDKEIKPEEKYLRHGRWHGNDGHGCVPYANYVWLKGNPTFNSIPEGYAIHHLDGDPLNDDISNLVLMQKHHHSAYHWKHKIIQSAVKIKSEFTDVRRTVFYPTKEPRIYKRSGHNSFYIGFRERINGKTRNVAIYSWEGIGFRSREQAERVKNIIWRESQ